MRHARVPLEIVEAGRVDYLVAWERQRALAAARADDIGPDTVLLLEHPPVYTAGKRTQPEDRPTDGTPVVDVDRGGRITWHGPGQLVGYPIVKLTEPVDVVGYVRLLEEILIAACRDLGIDTGRVAGRSGVWLAADETRPDRKIAAIGVRVARGVTMHGFALNCDPDLTAFDRIVPCGIADAGVTSLTVEAARSVGIVDALPVVRRRLAQGLDGELGGVDGASRVDRVGDTFDHGHRPVTGPGPHHRPGAAGTAMEEWPGSPATGRRTPGQSPMDRSAADPARPDHATTRSHR